MMNLNFTTSLKNSPMALWANISKNLQDSFIYFIESAASRDHRQANTSQNSKKNSKKTNVLIKTIK
jgi:hypothetical protein